MRYRHRPAHCETRPIVRNYDEFTVSAHEAAWLVAGSCGPWPPAGCTGRKSPLRD
jgi:hypothetical protein